MLPNYREEWLLRMLLNWKEKVWRTYIPANFHFVGANTVKFLAAFPVTVSVQLPFIWRGRLSNGVKFTKQKLTPLLNVARKGQLSVLYPARQDLT